MDYQSGAVSPVGSIEKGWGIIKDDYWVFVGMTVVAILITLVVAFILGLINTVITSIISGILGFASSNAGDAAKITATIAPQIISMVISLFTNVLVLTVSGVLFCGIYSALAKKVNTGVADFGELFSGTSKVVPCLTFAAVMSLIQFIINIVVLVIGAAAGVGAIGLATMGKNGTFNPAALGGLLFLVLGLFLATLVVNLIISVLTTFVYPLIADRNLSGLEALTLSIRAGMSNFGGILLLLILVGLMMLGGALACFIGIIFVAPIASASLFAAYQSVFGNSGGGFRQTPPPPPVWNTPAGQQPGY